MRDTSGSDRRGEAGLGLFSALFILVVLAAIAGFMVSLSGVQRHTTVLAHQSSRAFHASRSGIEWGVYKIISTSACPATTDLTLTEGGSSGFNVNVSCASSDHTESGNTDAVYQLVSVSTYGAFGDQEYVQRRLHITVTEP